MSEPHTDVLNVTCVCMYVCYVIPWIRTSANSLNLKDCMRHLNPKDLVNKEESCSLSASRTTLQTTEEKLRRKREREGARLAAEIMYRHGQCMYLPDDYSKDGHHSQTYLYLRAATCRPSVTCSLLIDRSSLVNLWLVSKMSDLLSSPFYRWPNYLKWLPILPLSSIPLPVSGVHMWPEHSNWAPTLPFSYDLSPPLAGADD